MSCSHDAYILVERLRPKGSDGHIKQLQKNCKRINKRQRWVVTPGRDMEGEPAGGAGAEEEHTRWKGQRVQRSQGRKDLGLSAELGEKKKEVVRCAGGVVEVGERCWCV